MVKSKKEAALGLISKLGKVDLPAPEKIYAVMAEVRRLNDNLEQMAPSLTKIAAFLDDKEMMQQIKSIVRIWSK